MISVSFLYSRVSIVIIKYSYTYSSGHIIGMCMNDIQWSVGWGYVPMLTVSGADPGFEKGGFNLVPVTLVAPLMVISENTTRGQLQKTKVKQGFSLEIQLSMLLTMEF